MTSHPSILRQDTPSCITRVTPSVHDIPRGAGTPVGFGSYTGPATVRNSGTSYVYATPMVDVTPSSQGGVAPSPSIPPGDLSLRGHLDETLDPRRLTSNRGYTSWGTHTVTPAAGGPVDSCGPSGPGGPGGAREPTETGSTPHRVPALAGSGGSDGPPGGPGGPSGPGESPPPAEPALPGVSSVYPWGPSRTSSGPGGSGGSGGLPGPPGGPSGRSGGPGGHRPNRAKLPMPSKFGGKQSETALEFLSCS